jgi:hypothetical protein
VTSFSQYRPRTDGAGTVSPRGDWGVSPVGGTLRIPVRRTRLARKHSCYVSPSTDESHGGVLPTGDSNDGTRNADLDRRVLLPTAGTDAQGTIGV